MRKDPVLLSGEMELGGEELDVEAEFWGDTFRREDILKYQDGKTKYIYDLPETTTYEICVEMENPPSVIDESHETGIRFPFRFECEYFDLEVPDARVARKDENMITLVAEIQWKPLH